ncbi:MAG: DUF2569 family protein [Ignavibacteriales bacterium]|nr:DUF2569 family protein [Ignavibacteriales bacterium]
MIENMNKTKILRLQISNGQGTKTYKVRKTPFYLGFENARNVFKLDGAGVADYHCKIIYFNNNYIIENLSDMDIIFNDVPVTKKSRNILRNNRNEIIIGDNRISLIVQEDIPDGNEGMLVDFDTSQIGGWLIIVAINLILMPILSVWGIISDIYALDYELPPSVSRLIYIEVLFLILIIIFGIILNILFYLRKKIFPLLFIILLSLSAFSDLLFYLFAPDIDNISRVYLVFFIRSALAAAIWISYFLKSRRVKLTFINN